MGKFFDLIGSKVGKLEVLYLIGKDKSGNYKWKCRCSCGNYSDVISARLINGKTKSCGCLRKNRGSSHHTYKHGEKGTPLYNVWVRIRYISNVLPNFYEGWSEYKNFSAWSLSSGYREGLVLIKLDKKLRYSPENCKWVTWEEYYKSGRTHGKTNTRIYHIYCGMKNRCNNPKNSCYDRYGGRDIKVCKEWEVFNVFYDWAINNGYSDNLTLDRKNNDLGYFPDNCKWSTRKEQANNCSGNNNLTYRGKTQTISKWSKDLGVSVGAIRQRINANLVEDKIFFPGSLQVKTGNGILNKEIRLIRIWRRMKDRCICSTNYSYKNYGSRGIKVCNDWLISKENFISWAMSHGYSDILTLDRKKVNGDYCPDNCRWITQAEQNRNRRNSVILTYKGKSMCKAEWARELGISEGGLTNRIKRKLPDEKIFYYGKIK